MNRITPALVRNLVLVVALAATTGAARSEQESGGGPGSWLSQYVGARTLGIANEDALLQLLRKAIKEGIPNARDRAVRFIGVLEIVALAPELAEIVKKDPKSTAAAYAAAALGRIGNQSHLEVLRAALKCGHGMTERAAKRAIERLTGP